MKKTSSIRIKPVQYVQVVLNRLACVFYSVLNGLDCVKTEPNRCGLRFRTNFEGEIFFVCVFLLCYHFIYLEIFFIPPWGISFIIRNFYVQEAAHGNKKWPQLAGADRLPSPVRGSFKWTWTLRTRRPCSRASRRWRRNRWCTRAIRKSSLGRRFRPPSSPSSRKVRNGKTTSTGHATPKFCSGSRPISSRKRNSSRLWRP